MRHLGPRSVLWALAAIVLVSCTPAGPNVGAARGDTQPAAGPKRIAAAILGEPYTLSQAVNNAGQGSARGVGEVEKIINAGLSVLDGLGNVRPVLAESVITVENGGWKLFPDGRMETTWKLRENTRWHDGTPLTGQDFLFALEVGSDPAIAMNSYQAYTAIEGIEAPDARTVVVRWREPFIDADQLFSPGLAPPLPRHILERSYREQKAGLLELPYWTSDFVGAGPFRVTEFQRGSHMVVTAFPDYVLGRPKLDEILIRFIQDPNTLVANILAGDVDVTIGRGFNLEQAIETDRQWDAGRAEFKPASWIAHYGQALTPSPAVLGDVRFRRALLLALNRQEMSDSLQSGQAPVAHSFLEPTRSFYKDVESSIVKSNYDPRQAAQIIDGLGFQKGADGFYLDGSGQRLQVETRTNAGDDLKDKIVFSTGDYWKRIGVDVNTFIVPRQQSSDREFRATYPGFDLVRQPFDPVRWLSTQAAVSSNNFIGENRTRFQNPELDAAINGWFTTIPMPGRLEHLRTILRILSDQLPALGTIHGPEPMMIADKLVNVSLAQAPSADETWNAHEWTVR
ncbi:MAG TPA: ABC transporter substrate-binding protein [Chloroflexota bacterium]